MARKKISACDVKSMLRKEGVNFNTDFHALSSSTVDKIVDAARAAGYRKSKNAPGSTGRMFYQHLARTKCSGGLGYTHRYTSGPNKGKRTTPWWVSQRWSVETPHIKTGEWVQIYSAKDKKKANADAAEWRAKTGQRTRVVPGAGHKTKRGF